jgi:hypothetical protein
MGGRLRDGSAIARTAESHDRNPQTYVDNIFFAKPGDYKKATIKIFDGGPAASFVDLPVVEGLSER